MRVFFSCSLQDEKFDNTLFHKIYKEIENLGYDHVDQEVVNLTREQFNKLKEETREVQVKRYNDKLEAIKKADICIFETSPHSLSTGFLIHAALDQQKPTIALYYQDMVPFFLSGIENEKLMIQSYSEKTLKKVLRDLLEQAREKRDKRFNFFISPKLLEFLERASTGDGITKSKYIRNLIVEHMREHKELADSTS